MFSDSLTLLYGKSLTGKTARMVHELADDDRVVIVDAKCNQLVALRGYVHLWPGLSENKVPVWSDREVVCFFREHLLSPFRVVVHCRSFQREHLELLCGLVLAVKNCVLAVDELGLFIPPGAAGVLPPQITSVIVSGTHDGIRFVGTAQRPSLVHKTARANAARTLIYRVTEADDVVLVGKLLPDVLAEKVSTLPDYCCIDWADARPAFLDYSYQGKLAAVIPAR